MDDNSDIEAAEEEAPVVAVDPLRRANSNKHVHPKVKEMIVQLCFWLEPEDIACYLDLHPRTVERVWSRYKRTGTVEPEIQPETTVGRPPTLDWTHRLVSSPNQPKLISRMTQIPLSQYLQRFLHRQPATQRKELQDRLLEKFGIWVSLPTISRVLNRDGVIYKKVFHPLTTFHCVLINCNTTVVQAGSRTRRR
jgi:transposase